VERRRRDALWGHEGGDSALLPTRQGARFEIAVGQRLVALFEQIPVHERWEAAAPLPCSPPPALTTRA
jgi:hypothetical protein